jgi:hypothetical protein
MAVLAVFRPATLTVVASGIGNVRLLLASAAMYLRAQPQSQPRRKAREFTLTSNEGGCGYRFRWCVRICLVVPGRADDRLAADVIAFQITAEDLRQRLLVQALLQDLGRVLRAHHVHPLRRLLGHEGRDDLVARKVRSA